MNNRLKNPIKKIISLKTKPSKKSKIKPKNSASNTTTSLECHFGTSAMKKSRISKKKEKRSNKNTKNSKKQQSKISGSKISTNS